MSEEFVSQESQQPVQAEIDQRFEYRQVLVQRLCTKLYHDEGTVLRLIDVLHAQDGLVDRFEVCDKFKRWWSLHVRRQRLTS